MKQNNENQPLTENELEALFQAARKLDIFMKYSDEELRQKLINLKYKIPADINDKDLQREIQAQEKRVINIDFLKNHLSQIKKDIEKGEISSISRTTRLLIEKLSSLQDIKTSAVNIYDEDQLFQALDKVADRITEVRDISPWGYLLSQESDIKQIAQEIATLFYQENTGLLRRIINVILGRRDEAIKEHDAFKFLKYFPASNDPIGTNIYFASLNNISWEKALFAESGNISLAKINLENLDYYALISLINFHFKLIDDIFLMAESVFNEALKDENDELILPREEYLPIIKKCKINDQKKETDFALKSLPEISEKLNVLHVRMNFLLRNIIAINRAFSLNENHPLKSGHLISFAAYVYYDWLKNLNLMYYNPVTYTNTTNDTFKISIEELLIDIKMRFEKLIPLLKEKLQTVGSYYLKSIEETIQKINQYQKLLPYFKSRTRLILKSLAMDMAAAYLSEHKYYLKYSISSDGKCSLISLEKLTEFTGELLIHELSEGLAGKTAKTGKLSSSSGDSDDVQELPEAYKVNIPKIYKPSKPIVPARETKAEKTVMKEPESFLSSAPDQVEISFFMSIAGRVEELLAKTNDNFPDNLKLSYQGKNGNERYSYLESRTYLDNKSGDELDREKLMLLQDAYEELTSIKNNLMNKIDKWKGKNISEINLDEAKKVRAIMGDIYMTIKNMVDGVNRASQDKTMYEEFTESVKNLYSSLNEISKRRI